MLMVIITKNVTSSEYNYKENQDLFFFFFFFKLKKEIVTL